MFELILGLLYLVLGCLVIEVFGEVLNDIESKPVRVISRIVMLLWWPAWLLFVAVAITVAFVCMVIAELFK